MNSEDLGFSGMLGVPMGRGSIGWTMAPSPAAESDGAAKAMAAGGGS